MINNKKYNKIYVDWYKSKKLSPMDQRILVGLSDNYVERNFTEEKMSFGTAGIRSVMGLGTNRMNEFTYAQMATGFALHILEKYGKGAKVIVAHDNRFNADKYSLVCANVLTSHGINVFLIEDNELKATPIISYLIIQLKLQGGIIVTASHNPKNYLGFKVYNNTGGQILPDEEKNISRLMPENKNIIRNEYTPNNDLISYISNEWITKYFEDAKACLIKTDVNVEKRFPIIFTAHHGTASYDLPKFLATLNYVNVIPVQEQCYPDPNFTNSPNSNPEDKESFKLALDYAKKNNSDIILAVDPDADRLGVAIKHKGEWRYITGNEMGTIFTYYLLENKNFGKNPYVVSTFVSTYLIDKIANQYGCKVYRTPTGFKWLGNQITQNIKNNLGNFVVAFEEAIGSLNSTINRDKDSFQASALALEIFDFYAQKEMSLIDVLEQEIYPKFGYWAGQTVSYLISGENWKEEITRIFENLKVHNIEKILDLKVKKIHWNEIGNVLEWNLEKGNWIKFRMSGTEPKFKIYYNLFGDSLEGSQKLLESVRKEVDFILKNI